MKIKMNVVWDKRFEHGAILAEILSEYFCSGNLADQKDEYLSIPVRCYETDTYDFTMQRCSGYLTVAVILAEDLMFANDKTGGQFLEKLHREEEDFLLLPVVLSKNASSRLRGQYISAYAHHDSEEELQEEAALRKDPAWAPYYNQLKNTQFASKIRYMVRQILEAVASQYFRLNVADGMNDKRLRIFIGHTKSSGKNELEDFQSNFACQTRTDTFVDKNFIAYGDYFDEDIPKELEVRCLIVLWTDELSTRDWCIKEILYAKKRGMPILIVDALQTGEHRMSPFIGNVPIVRYNVASKNKKLLFAQIYEKFCYEVLYVTLNKFRRAYSEKTLVLGRKVELLDLAERNPSVTRIVYPDPPLGTDEFRVIKAAAGSLTIQTPITNTIAAGSALFQKKIMISSAHDPRIDRFDRKSCCIDIAYAVKELTRYLIFLGATILNGGNFEQDGFNALIMEQIRKYRKIIGNYTTESRDQPRENPVYCIHYLNGYNINRNREKYTALATKYNAFPEIEFRMPRIDAIDKKRALGDMRERITDDADFHIAVGGMLRGSEVTGLEREVEMSVSKGKSVYLLGGFGFKTARLCERYVTKERYVELHNGLSLSDNLRLANSYDIELILKTVIKGWENVCRNDQSHRT